MGVTGLWQILDSVGHPIKLDGLEGKRLGVDANIWLYKFIRGFKEKDNATSLESHKLGLFNRISKLLFYKIKPVFVFDGPAPVLKRKTLEKRHNVQTKVTKVQEIGIRLLAEQLKQHYPDKNIDDVIIKLPELRSNNLVAAEKLGEDDEELFRLPTEIIDLKEEESDESQDVLYEDNLPPTKVDIHSTDFANLPPEIRYEILHDIKAARRRIITNDLPEDAGSFSQLQMERLRNRRMVQEKIEKCERDICASYTGTCEGSTAMFYVKRNSSPSDQEFSSLKMNQPVIQPQQNITDKQQSTINQKIYEESKKPSKVDHDQLDRHYPDKDIDDVRNKLPECKSNNITAIGKFACDDGELLNLPTGVVDSKEEESDESRDVIHDDNLPPKKVDIDSTEVVNLSPESPQETVEQYDRNVSVSQSPTLNASTTTIYLDQTVSSESQLDSGVQSELTQNRSRSPSPVKLSRTPSPVKLSRTPSPVKLIQSPEFASVQTDSSDSLETVLDGSSPSTLIETQPRESDGSNIELREEDQEIVQLTPGVAKVLDDSDIIFEEYIPAKKVDIEPAQSSGSQPIFHQEPSISEAPRRRSSSMSLEPGQREPRQREPSPVTMSQPGVTLAQTLATKTQQPNVNRKIVEEAKELLRLFGIPYIDAAGEAEAQCALLEELKLTDGTITDDSDVWLFGSQTVFRHFFSDDKYVMQYKMSDIKFHISMTRENLVCFAMLVGSDYTDGIQNVGPVAALEVLSEFPGDNLDPLIKFKKWRENYSRDGKLYSKKRAKFLKWYLPEEFPSRSVFEGYMRPMADASTEEFKWGTPELDELREYARRNFGWNNKKIDDKLLPVMKKLSERSTQSRIDSFFFKTAANRNPELFRSKRVNEALGKISKTKDEVVLTEDEEDEEVEKPKQQVNERKRKATKAIRKRTTKARKG